MLIVNELSKKYKNNKGIFKMSFKAKEGQVIAFVGPNGAGKTSLFNILGGVLRADEGDCLIDNINLKDINSSDIAYLSETPFMFPEFTPTYFLNYVNIMKEIGAKKENIEDLLNIFNLKDVKDKKIKYFSMGMKKRVAIAASFLGTPKLMILDEPTNGLDTESVIALKNMIKKMSGKKAIILLSSHILDFVNDICDEVYFIKNGKIVSGVSDKEKRLEDIYLELFGANNIVEIRE